MAELFPSHKAAARALLTHPEPRLTQRSGQFCGGLMFSDEPLTEKQARWLANLLRKHGLPPLTEGDRV
jgi:hypothetical protein